MDGGSKITDTQIKQCNLKADHINAYLADELRLEAMIIYLSRNRPNHKEMCLNIIKKIHPSTKLDRILYTSAMKNEN